MATTLDALVDALQRDLVPTAQLPSPARVVTGVHISELLDPTPFLNGGELLLTTGMDLPKQITPLTGYVTRLAGAGVVALGFGIGPVHPLLPAPLRTAAERAGLPLLLVPADTPFQTIVTHFFAGERRAESRGLTGALGAMHALVRAATHGEPGREQACRQVIRVLAGAVDGWAAHIESSGRPDAVWPRSAAGNARRAGREVGRIRAAGALAGATFPLGGDDVLLQPVGTADGGYVACGHRRPIPAQLRHLTLAACAVLDLAASRMSDNALLRAAGPAVVGRLLALGRVDAATDYVRAGGAEWPDVVRVGCAVNGTPLAGLPHVDALARSSGPERTTWVWAAQEAPAAWHRVARASRGGGVLGPAVASREVVDELGRVAARTAALAPGQWQDLGAAPASGGDQTPGGEVVEQALAALSGYRRADLVGTLSAYLGHRGRIEGTADALGVHRNTIRHRLALIARVGDVDVDDPDTAAHLWLALRREGLA